MKLLRPLFYLLILPMLVACDAGIQLTPTPFPTAVPITPLPSQSLAPTAEELIAEPEIYENNILQLTGQYRRAPRLICDSETHRSPATWQLITGGLLIDASGYDAQLRTLIPDNLTLTVEGRWQQWRGPVGCGKEAIPTDIWYLVVNKIISPSPLARVTLTPGGTISEIPPETPTEENPDGSEDVEIENTPLAPTFTPTTLFFPPTPTAISTQPIDTPTPPVEPTRNEPTHTPTATRDNGDPTNTPTPTRDGQVETTATMTATTTIAGTLTLTPTPDGDATETPTATPTRSGDTGQATPTPSPTINSSSPITNVGTIQAQELAVNQLRRDQIHSWTFDVTASTVVTVMVAAANNRDPIITIIDPIDTVLINQNQTGAGQIERVDAFTLSTIGTHQIQIRTNDGGDAQYFIMLITSSSYNFNFQTILTYGASTNSTLSSQSDHFWIFSGTADDTICIVADPDTDKDLFLELYGPSANRISPFIDDGNAGESEELEFTLEESGLHAIRVGEFNFEEASYLLTLDLGSC